MTHRIDTRPLSPDKIDDSQPRDRVAEGSMNGERVVVQQDAQSLLQNAAEEITFGAGEVVEKDLSQRKARKEGTINRVVLAQLYAQKSRQMKRFEVLIRFHDYMRSIRPSNIQDMQREAEGFFEDVTQQHLALSFLKEALEGEGENGELCKLAGASVEYLMDSRGPEIRAGLNVIDTALELSEEGLGSPTHLCDFYRDVVLKYEGVRETFDSITKNFGMKDLPGALSYLIRAVSSDLHSKGPSISPLELKRILDDLYHLESLGNLYRDCSALIDRTNKAFHATLSLSPYDVVEHVLSFREDPRLAERQGLKLAESVGLEDLEARIYFLREMKELVRLMPLKLFSDQETRNSLVTGMQRALDALIEQEE